MEYITTSEAALKWNISTRQVQSDCESGRIKEVIRVGHMWLIHKNAEKPVDGRTKAARGKIRGIIDE